MESNFLSNYLVLCVSIYNMTIFYLKDMASPSSDQAEWMRKVWPQQEEMGSMLRIMHATMHDMLVKMEDLQAQRWDNNTDQKICFATRGMTFQHLMVKMWKDGCIRPSVISGSTIFSMGGEALKWLLWMDEEGKLTSLSEFMEDVMKRFGQTNS